MAGRWGRGTIEERGPDHFVVRVSHKRDPATGKRIRETRVVRGTRRQAERVRNAMLEQKKDHGSAVGGARMTLDAWIKQRVQTADLSPRTRVDQLALWTRFSTPALRATPLRDVSADALQTRINQLRELRSAHTGRILAPRTVRIWFNIVAAALAEAHRLRRVPSNVARDVTAPKDSQASKIGCALTAEEMQTFLDHDPEDRLHALWHVAANTGARPSEVLALRWIDWDEKAGVLHIRRTLVRVGKALYYAPLKAKDRETERTAPIEPALAAVLKRHQLRQRGEMKVLGREKWVDPSLMFTTAIGSALERHNVASAFRTRLKAAGVRSVRWYDLRHSFGTHAMANGGNAKAVADIMGHSKVTMTLQHYTHPDEAEKRATVARLPWQVARDA